MLGRAAGTAAALAPVGRRRARKEAASERGLVVLRARYGPPSALDKDDEEVGAACAEALNDGGDEEPSSSSVITASPPHPDDLDEDALVAHGGAIDVTPAVRLLVEGGALKLSGGAPRPGLLGFSDPAPGEPKALSVRFVHGGKAYRVRLPDGAPVNLPARAGGALPAGTAEAVEMMKGAEALKAGGGE